MKKILITATSSYVGNHLQEWLKKWPEDYYAKTISTKGTNWLHQNFADFDVVVHVAGIAHQDKKKIPDETYFKVNRDLTIDLAKKAKKEGVKQFIFLSTINVYGNGQGIGSNQAITKNTIPSPINAYGASKWEAEKRIELLQSSEFKVGIIRAPMIYGKDTKGNFNKLISFTSKVNIFPYIINKRSMLFIDNLSEFIRFLIDFEKSGLFFPQNKEYVSVVELVTVMTRINGKKINLVTCFNPLLILLSKRIKTINKVFGNFIYDLSMSEYEKDYRIVTFEESIRLSKSDE